MVRDLCSGTATGSRLAGSLCAWGPITKATAASREMLQLRVSAPLDRFPGTGSPSHGATPLPSAGSQGPGGTVRTFLGAAIRLCELHKLLPPHLLIHSLIHLLSTFNDASTVPQGHKVWAVFRLHGVDCMYS